MNILEKTLRKIILEAFLVAMFTTMANKVVDHLECKVMNKKKESFTIKGDKKEKEG